MNIDYRSQARRALRQVHGELEAGGETRLRSAALQLRMAIRLQFQLICIAREKTLQKDRLHLQIS